MNTDRLMKLNRKDQHKGRIGMVAASILLLMTWLNIAEAALPTPTPQQLALLQNLSPEQQKALAAQYGVDLGSLQQSQGATEKTPAAATVLRRNVEAKMQQEMADQSAKKTASEVKRADQIRPFGYDLFAGQPSTFEPLNDIPVSSDYVLGPGDSLNIKLYGKQNQSYELQLNQEGSIYFPDIGPINLAGQNFAEAKRTLQNTVKRQMIGVKSSISMGSLRSIRVFVLGEAFQPGSYVVSSLSTITNALYLSGGISSKGSLRNIQLKRKGELLATLDLYDLLLRGDTSGDKQLRSGDVVFIPPLGKTIGIKGQVRRPAIYEIKNETTIQDAVDLAGGLLSTAYPRQATIERIEKGDHRTLLQLDLSQSNGLRGRIMNGDTLNIPAVLGDLKGIVKLSGHVKRPIQLNWRDGMRISDVIHSAEQLQPHPDLNYGLILRHRLIDSRLQVLSFSLNKIFTAKNEQDDLLLQARDEIIVFSQSSNDRRGVIDPVIDTLRNQAGVNAFSLEAGVNGDVRFPGVYPLTEGMTVKQLIEAAGGFTERAYALNAELNRSVVDENKQQKFKRMVLNFKDQSGFEFKLQSRDQLRIKAIPNWNEQEVVTLNGEVRFPGVYPIYKDDTLRDVLKRAGGVTEYAYVPGAIFSRLSLQKKQAEKLKEMQQRLSSELAKAKLTQSENTKKPANATSQDTESAQKLLAQLENTQALGRLVIDLQKVIDKADGYRIPLVNGDTLTVPRKSNAVTIVGEVQFPISQVFEPGISVEEYIRRSGGFTDSANDDKVYIIRANGSVKMPGASKWYTSTTAGLEPGDTIVVPLDTSKISQLDLWRDVSQVFYQIALGAAAVGSL